MKQISPSSCTAPCRLTCCSCCAPLWVTAASLRAVSSNPGDPRWSWSWWGATRFPPWSHEETQLVLRAGCGCDASGSSLRTAHSLRRQLSQPSVLYLLGMSHAFTSAWLLCNFLPRLWHLCLFWSYLTQFSLASLGSTSMLWVPLES